MLLVDDNAKEILEEHGIGYGEYMSPGDVYLTAILNMAVETAIKYNEDNIEDPVVVENYVNFIKQSDAVKKCLNKMEKLNHDILNIVCDITDGKQEEINNPKSEVITEE